MEKYTEGYVFTIEKVVWSESKVVGIEADGWTEVQAEMCRETNSICSPSTQRGWQHYRIRIRDTAPTSVQKRSRCSFCSLFFFAPPQGRWQGRGSRRVKGQSPRVGHTYTPKHFISITNQSQVHVHREGVHCSRRPVTSLSQWIIYCWRVKQT